MARAGLASPADDLSSADAAAPARWQPPGYWPFVVPALVVVVGVIVFPWAFTLWMSLHEWKVGAAPAFVGLSNYARLPTDPRFLDAVWQTLVYTALSVVLPLILGTLAACVFHAKFPLRGFLRGVFILPMMATPVAIALVWTMMFHPQLGVLNYLLSLVGIPPQLWVFHPATVIPSLVLVETWQWTPLVMLIVLGGLAALPTEPYESAQIDGASIWQMFRHITLPLVAPFLFVAAMIRMIDAVKSFDIIFAITQGRARHGVRDDQHLPLQRRLRLLRRGLRLGDRRGVLSPHHRARRRPAGGPQAHAGSGGVNWRWLLRQAALLFSVLVIVSPVILFFVWMLSLSVKYEIDNAAYPPVLIPERFAWKTTSTSSNRTGSRPTSSTACW